MALLVLLLLGLGWYMADLPKGPGRGPFFSLHKSLGLLVFGLAFMRIAWRAVSPPPPLPEGFAPLLARASKIAHGLLYLCFFLQPITGYLSSVFAGKATAFFGLPLPIWGGENKPLNDLFGEAHEAFGIMLALLIVLHVLGALVHALRHGRAYLRRMT
jgi:cytochrome b561